ncbi:hypothetical protein [Petrimonas sp.]|uniref:hypothetical protein n=1 Tax=Petrimonas sp. TaxID=2023866 RepID=UPI003F51A6AC
MKLICLFVIFVFTFVACETENLPGIVYGKIEQENSHLSKIMKDGKLHIEIIRDTHGKIIETRKYYNPDDKPNVEKYNYNSDNQIIERHYSVGYTDFYVYKNGRLAEMTSKNSQNPEWNQKLIYYHDSNGRIVKADKYFNDKKSGYILFEYDKRGNTTARKEYMSDNSDYVFGEHRCTYDNNKNPFQDLSLYPLDMIQNNNATSSYYYVLYMSSMPATKILSYKYNESSFPASFSTHIKEYPDYGQENFTYVYN